jgi:hypothetical protein
MRCNILTWIVLFIIIAFIVYVYTSKLPVEQYMEEYGELEHFLAIAQGDDSDSDSDSDSNEGFENLDDDSELVENLTYSPTCYGFSERQCVNTPECEWTITDGYGSCRNRTSWWSPLYYGGWYNWWNDYWSLNRWYEPSYYGYYSYPSYYYYYPTWNRRFRRRYRRHYPRRHRRHRRFGRRSFRRGRGRRMRAGRGRARSGGRRGGARGGRRR